jgi:hypothetical protein
LSAWELLATAKRLAEPQSPAVPSQADLRRAVSTAYYALFRDISECCAEQLLAGCTKPLSRARDQITSSLDHRDVESACQRVKLTSSGFPKDIRDIANTFLELRKSRELADYAWDRRHDFVVPHVLSKIKACEDAMDLLSSGRGPDDFRAFAVLICVKAKSRR